LAILAKLADGLANLPMTGDYVGMHHDRDVTSSYQLLGPKE
jgi:hypothetical protein